MALKVLRANEYKPELLHPSIVKSLNPLTLDLSSFLIANTSSNATNTSNINSSSESLIDGGGGGGFNPSFGESTSNNDNDDNINNSTGIPTMSNNALSSSSGVSVANHSNPNNINIDISLIDAEFNEGGDTNNTNNINNISNVKNGEGILSLDLSNSSIANKSNNSFKTNTPLIYNQNNNINRRMSHPPTPPPSASSSRLLTTSSNSGPTISSVLQISSLSNVDNGSICIVGFPYSSGSFSSIANIAPSPLQSSLFIKK
jgi:hypothetical protein